MFQHSPLQSSSSIIGVKWTSVATNVLSTPTTAAVPAGASVLYTAQSSLGNSNSFTVSHTGLAATTSTATYRRTAANANFSFVLVNYPSGLASGTSVTYTQSSGNWGATTATSAYLITNGRYIINHAAVEGLITGGVFTGIGVNRTAGTLNITGYRKSNTTFLFVTTETNTTANNLSAGYVGTSFADASLSGASGFRSWPFVLPGTETIGLGFTTTATFIAVGINIVSF